MSDEQPTASNEWQGKHVYLMALICLGLAVAIGYFFRGSQLSSNKPSVSATAKPAASVGNAQGQMPTLEHMKQMADKTAEPLLEKLKADPNNPALLNQVGMMYRATHQFKQAVTYYQKALEIDPKNAAVRTDLASCLYYEGDIDGALAQLNQSLTYDPKFAGALMNIGIIEWKGKNDPKSAVGAWKKLLKLNPDFPQRGQVEKLIAQVQKDAA